MILDSREGMVKRSVLLAERCRVLENKSLRIWVAKSMVVLVAIRLAMILPRQATTAQITIRPP